MNTATASPWRPPKAQLVGDDSSQPLHAGFWRRWASSFLDSLLLWTVNVPLLFLLGGDGVVNLIYLVIAWLYYSLMHSSPRQATLGKMAFGIKVASTQGERISFLRATGRYFATWLSTLILGIGFLMAAFTQRKQALHDMIASTVVVRADASPQAVQEGGGTMPITAGVWICGIFLALVPVAGIVAAIAIPAYQDYVSRAGMAGAYAAGTGARSAVAEHFAAKGRMPASLAEAGFVPQANPHVARIDADFSGPATIRVYPSSPRAQGGALVFTAAPREPLQWTCSADGIAPKLVPASCRR